MRDDESIQQWAKLRNAFVHSPPGQAGHLVVDSRDLYELKCLFFDVIDDLWRQKQENE